jgi:trimeric autotransporter adhesin
MVDEAIGELAQSAALIAETNASAGANEQQPTAETTVAVPVADVVDTHVAAVEAGHSAETAEGASVDAAASAATSDAAAQAAQDAAEIVTAAVEVLTEAVTAPPPAPPAAPEIQQVPIEDVTHGNPDNAAGSATATQGGDSTSGAAALDAGGQAQTGPQSGNEKPARTGYTSRFRARRRR